MVSVLLTVAFLASATIALSHVLNRRFIAPRYDCALNLLGTVAGRRRWRRHYGVGCTTIVPIKRGDLT